MTSSWPSLCNAADDEYDEYDDDAESAYERESRVRTELLDFAASPVPTHKSVGFDALEMTPIRSGSSDPSRAIIQYPDTSPSKRTARMTKRQQEELRAAKQRAMEAAKERVSMCWRKLVFAWVGG